MKRGSFNIAFLVTGLVILVGMSQVIGAEEIPGYEEEVVVTATRVSENASETPGQTEVITKVEIESLGATNVSEALIDNGVTMATNGGKFGVAHINLDGSSSTQTLILVNGVPANSGCTGMVDLRYFPVAPIQQIEVAHGPLSALYGSNAVGGVVNIITDLTGEPSNQLSLSGGGFSTTSIDLKQQKEKWGIIAGLNTTDGFRDFTANQNSYLLGQYDLFERGDEYLKLYWQFLNADGESPGSLSLKDQANQAELNLGINLNGRSYIGNGLWEYKLFTQYLDNHYDSIKNDTKDRHQAKNLGIDTAGQYNLGKHELISGVSLREDYFESTKNDGDHSQNSVGLFLQDSYRLDDHFKLITGLRWDHNSEFASPLSPRIFLVDTLTPEWTLKLGYGRTFRAPSILDLYYNDPYMMGNPALIPETGERYDLIAEWKKDHQAFAMDLYLSNLEDGIDWRSTNPSDYNAPWKVENIQKVNIRGLNLNWENTLTDSLTAKIGYKLMDKEVTDPVLGDNQEYNYFGRQQLDIGFYLKYLHWQSGLSWHYVKDRAYVSYGSLVSMPDYTLLNFNFKYLVKQDLSLVLSIDNLGNEKYQVNDDYPMPGRCYTFRTNYSF